MKNNQQIKLGAFITLGLVLFMGVIYYLGKKNFIFRNAINITTLFQDVKGLQVGNNVRFAGVNVGTVSAITIVNDSTVGVHLSIDKSYQEFLKRDSKATIGTEGLMGNTLLTIIPGNSTAVVQQGDTI